MSSPALDNTDSSMLPDNAFIKHAESTQQTLKEFNTIRSLGALGPAKTSLFELVQITVRSFCFISP